MLQIFNFNKYLKGGTERENILVNDFLLAGEQFQEDLINSLIDLFFDWKKMELRKRFWNVLTQEPALLT